MKNLIKKWLGITELEKKSESLKQIAFRLTALELDNKTSDGQMAKEDSVKELVFHICRYLGVNFRREFYQEIESQTMITKRRFWLEKGKKNTKIKEGGNLIN